MRVNGTGEKAVLKIKDGAGIRLQEVQVPLNGLTSFRVKINALPAGTYYLQLKNKNRKETKRFINE